MRKKNLRKKNRKKFKNFIYQFCYLNTSFSGHLEQNQCCPELPSCASVFTPSTSFIYIIIKQKNISFALIKFYLIQNKIMFQIDKRSYVEGTFFDIPVLNRRAENCPELPGLFLKVVVVVLASIVIKVLVVVVNNNSSSRESEGNPTRERERERERERQRDTDGLPHVFFCRRYYYYIYIQYKYAYSNI